MLKQSVRQCHGCKSLFPFQESLEHYQFAGIGKYGIATPECLAAYFDILAKENELYGYPPAHRLIVDAYSVQHPRIEEWQKKFNIELRLVRASIQSVPVHLIALYCAIEKQMDLRSIAKVMDAILTNMSKHDIQFNELKSPTELGFIKVGDVKEAFFAKECTLDEYTKLADNWARAAWDAWQEHHATIRHWYEKYS